ncbi:MFS transporter [Ornithinimicrobium humiphilum]|uniref:EmrB/QacA subfamily drug resistance transporter n=1 Tax=Ornithinimicrobium humiphilum TaxID=125288 RepID=A0A543KNA7_9MICO|nr:MDR family MFS transporter [Ornithinimicrobium humiphilum]TQM96544.1 EmrB/QacA subfamily drug resistance transporter [Ornithinimicrobium humiphilum]
MAEPAPAPDRALPENPWPALWALVIGFFMILVDSTIVSVATPALMSAFGAGVDEVLWVTSSYLLAYAVPLLVTGRLGDRIGPKRVYMVGLTVFTLASLWCGLSGELDLGIAGLVAARAAQGLGASMMTPQTMTVITRTFPAERRGQAMALWGATAGVATLVGPLVGGLLVDTLGWEWIFFVNIPVGVVGLVLAARLVPRLPTSPHRFDLFGVALSALGLFCAVFALQEGQAFGWGRIWGPVSVPGLLVAGIGLLVGFVWWQARNPGEPLVPLDLFRDRNFSLANGAIMAMGFTVTAMVFPFYIWAQSVRGLSPTMAALLMAPSSVMSFVLAPLAGRLTDRVHPRLLVGSGTTLLAFSIWLLSRNATPDSPLWIALVAAFLMGISNPLVWGPLSTTATRNLAMDRAGAGSGVYNTTRQMGAVLGSAAIAMLMQSRITARLGEGAAAAQDGMDTSGASLPPGVAEGLSRAMAEALLLPAAVILVGAVLAMFFERPRHLVRR